MPRRRPDAVTAACAAAIVAALVWAILRGLQNHTLQPDEFAFGISGAQRFAEDFLGTLLSGSPVNRGPERLVALLLAGPYALIDDTPAMLRVARVLTAVVYVAAALPAYGLARLLALTRPQAALVAALAVLTPWLMYGATLLNVTPAYPLTTALVWAVVLAVTRPSPRHDVLVLVVAALGALARTGNLPFLAIAAVAVLVQVWRDRAEGEPLRALPARLLRTHPVLVGAGVLTVAAVLAIGVTSIIGGQYRDAVPDDLSAGRLVERAGVWGALLALGSSFVVVIVALPWAVRQAVRPTDRAAGAFAVTALALFAVFVASTLNAPVEERYVAVLAALAPVGFGAALFRREASVVATLAGGLVVLRIVTANVPAVDVGSYSWMVRPARQFWYRAVELRLTSLGLPEGWDVVALIVVAAAGAAVLLAVLARRRATVAVFAAGAVLAVAGVAQAQYNMAEWLAGEGARAFSFEQRAFVDEAVGDADVFGWDHNPRGEDLVPFALSRAQVYNRSIDGAMRLEGTTQTWSCCDRDVVFAVDPETGRLPAAEQLPRFALAPPGFIPVGFVARVAATSPALAGFAVLDLGDRPRVSYTVSGAEADVVRDGVLRGFAAADGGPAACARVVVAEAAPGAGAEYRVGPQRGTLAPGETRELRVPLPGGRAAIVSDGGVRLAGVALDC